MGVIKGVKMRNLFQYLFFIVFLCLSFNCLAEIDWKTCQPLPHTDKYYTYTQDFVAGYGDFASCEGAQDIPIFVLLVKNVTLSPISFEGVSLTAISKNNSIYSLDLADYFNTEEDIESLTLKPNNLIGLYFESPEKNKDITKVKELYLQLKNGVKIFLVPEPQIEKNLSAKEKFKRGLRNFWINIKNLFSFAKASKK